jgi:hypothetical protein
MVTDSLCGLKQEILDHFPLAFLLKEQKNNIANLIQLLKKIKSSMRMI